MFSYSIAIVCCFWARIRSILEEDGNISLILFYDASTGFETDESDIFWTGLDALIYYFSLGIFCSCDLYLSYF